MNICYCSILVLIDLVNTSYTHSTHQEKSRVISFNMIEQSVCVNSLERFNNVFVKECCATQLNMTLFITQFNFLIQPIKTRVSDKCTKKMSNKNMDRFARQIEDCIKPELLYGRLLIKTNFYISMRSRIKRHQWEVPACWKIKYNDNIKIYII